MHVDDLVLECSNHFHMHTRRLTGSGFPVWIIAVIAGGGGLLIFLLVAAIIVVCFFMCSKKNKGGKQVSIGMQ